VDILTFNRNVSSIVLLKCQTNKKAKKKFWEQYFFESENFLKILAINIKSLRLGLKEQYFDIFTLKVEKQIRNVGIT
jgi:hypothetical protein